VKGIYKDIPDKSGESWIVGMNRNICFILFIMWLSNYVGYMVLMTGLPPGTQRTTMKGESGVGL